MLIAIGCFFVGQFVGTLLVDACPVDIRFPETRVLMRLAERMPVLDVALFGSSRLELVPASGVADGLADEPSHATPAVLNLSVPAGDSAAAELMLANVVARGRAPRVAIVEVSPETLTRNNRWLAFDVIRFFTWRDVIRAGPELVAARALNKAIGSRLVPFYVHRQDLWTWIARAAGVEQGTEGQRVEGLYTVHELEIRTLPSEERALQLSRQSAAIFRRSLRDYEVGGVAHAALVRFLARCREAGTTAVLLVMPASSHFREIYTPEVESRFQANMTHLAHQYGARYVDYRRRVDDRLFYDAYHLRPEGARAVAKLIAHEVLAPLRANLRPADPAVLPTFTSK